MNAVEMLIAWTIRISLLLQIVVAFYYLQRRQNRKIHIAFKCLWTASFALCALHVFAAFQYVHRWSHSAAYDATARETYEQLGFSYGAGVFFNYLFLIVWALDVFWTWRASDRRSKIVRWSIAIGRAYLLFIAINSVVVFETGWLRIAGIAATLLLAGFALQRRAVLLRP